MSDIFWDKELNKWRGQCPRCGEGGFFDVLNTSNYADASIDVVACFSGHPFCIEYKSANGRSAGGHSYPVRWKKGLPGWLPEEFHGIYEELLEARARRMFNSVIALSGILLDAQVNTLLKNKKEKEQSLYTRLNSLIEKGTIEPGEFSDATLARVGRKKVIHPDDLKTLTTQEQADEIFRATNDYLESRYRFKTAKSLPAGDTREKEK